MQVAIAVWTIQTHTNTKRTRQGDVHTDEVVVNAADGILRIHSLPRPDVREVNISVDGVDVIRRRHETVHEYWWIICTRPFASLLRDIVVACSSMIVTSQTLELVQEPRMTTIGRDSKKNRIGTLHHPESEENVADLLAQRLTTSYIACSIEIRPQNYALRTGQGVVPE